jgi:hypothetical protein
MERMHNPNYQFDTYPAATSNQITYNYFCTLGGLTNPVCAKVQKQNGTHIYFTYHRIDIP